MQVNQSNFSKCENGKSLIQIYPLINYVKQKNVDTFLCSLLYYNFNKFVSF